MLHDESPNGGINFQAQQSSSRLLVTLVIDTSSSMAQRGRIQQLNNALPKLREALLGSHDLQRTGEIALVTFGERGVQVRDPRGGSNGEPDEPFCPVSQFNPPEFTADGVTPMVDAVRRGLGLIHERKTVLRKRGVSMKARPLMYVITDGGPTDEKGNRTDEWRSLVPVIREQEKGNHLLFFTFGVEDADRNVLEALAPNSTRMLDSTDFKTVITLLSASVDSASGATMNEAPDTVYKNSNTRLDEISRFLKPQP